jgi:hypothetical protein
MKDEQDRFLARVGRPQVRLTVEQAAWILNCQPHDIPILVRARLLRPLGSPPPNGSKYFATDEVLEQAKDRSWLAKITNTVCVHWQKKNARKKGSWTDGMSAPRAVEALGESTAR